jgi:DNA-binding transcriptional LysR family regulator
LPSTFPPLESLDLFCSVVQLGSLSRAAELHGVAQPSASARIRQLERQLGVTLLTRSPSGSLPTATGSLVANWAAQLLTAAGELSAGVAALKNESPGRLVVAASFTIAEYLLPTWLGALHRKHPGMAVELEVVNSTGVLRRVREGSAHLGFIESPGSTGGLSSQQVGADELVVVAAPAHAWARRRRPLTARALTTTPLVLREVGSGTRDALVSALATAGLGPPVAALELGSTAAVKAAVEAGAGPAVLSRLAVHAELGAGRLVKVDVTGLHLQRNLRAVWRSGTSLTPSALSLLDLAKKLSPFDPS